MKTKVGAVTKSERDEIRRIYERRNGLIELFGILTPEKTEIYDRVVEDMGRTTARFQQWWDRMGEKYAWTQSDSGRWEIDFDTCEIFLVEEK